MLKRGAELGKIEFGQETSAPPAGQQMNANNAAQQARQMQVQQLQAQQAQQAQMARMQNALTYGAGKPPGGVIPGLVGQRPPNAGVVQPIINGNGLNVGGAATNWNGNGAVQNSNGVIFPAPVMGNQPVQNGGDNRRKLRVINTR
jgi:hypothetical protein